MPHKKHYSYWNEKSLLGSFSSTAFEALLKPTELLARHVYAPWSVELTLVNKSVPMTSKGDSVVSWSFTVVWSTLSLYHLTAGRGLPLALQLMLRDAIGKAVTLLLRIITEGRTRKGERDTICINKVAILMTIVLCVYLIRDVCYWASIYLLLMPISHQYALPICVVWHAVYNDTFNFNWFITITLIMEQLPRRA